MEYFKLFNNIYTLLNKILIIYLFIYLYIVLHIMNMFILYNRFECLMYFFI